MNDLNTKKEVVTIKNQNIAIVGLGVGVVTFSIIVFGYNNFQYFKYSYYGESFFV